MFSRALVFTPAARNAPRAHNNQRASLPMETSKPFRYRHRGVPKRPAAFLGSDREKRSSSFAAAYGSSRTTGGGVRRSLGLGTASVAKRREYIPSQRSKPTRAASAGVKKRPMLVRPGSGYRKMGKFARSSLQSSQQVARLPYRRPQSVGPKQRRSSLPTALLLSSSSSSSSSSSPSSSLSSSSSSSSSSSASRVSPSSISSKRSPYGAHADGFGSLVKSSVSKALVKRSESSSASILVAQAFYESEDKEEKKERTGAVVVSA